MSYDEPKPNNPPGPGKGVKGAWANVKALKLAPKQKPKCKTCKNLRRHGSAYCQRCSDKHNA